MVGGYLAEGCDGALLLIEVWKTMQNLESLSYCNLTSFVSLSGVEKMGAIFRAKRTRCVYLPADSSDSMDDKDIPPNQNKFFPSGFEAELHSHPGSSNEEDSSSGFMEDVESDLSGSNSSESESDSSQTEPDVDKEMVIFSG